MRIVFFDGYCSLCSTLVDFLMRVDKTSELKFASLQGETAGQLLGQQKEPVDVDTVIYLRNTEKYEQSTAVIQILSDIGGLWRIAKIFLFVPKPIRNFLYGVVAKNRFRFIGRRETCRMPTPSEKSRLLP